MGGKSDHTIAVNDEISFWKKATQKGKSTPWGEGEAHSKPKTSSFSGRRPDGILGHHETLQLEAEWFVYTQPPTRRHWRWERLLFAVWSRCGWTKWREDVQLEKPINQLPRPVCLDKYHLLLNSQRKISPVLGTCHFSAYYAEAFVSFDIPNPMSVSEWWSYLLHLILFWQWQMILEL